MKRKQFSTQDDVQVKKPRIRCSWFERLTKRAKNVFMGLEGSNLCKNVPKPILKIITEMGGGNMEDCVFCDWGVFEEPEDRNHTCFHISSPHYSPTCFSYYTRSPTYSPSSPCYSPGPKSPKFSPTWPSYNPRSPAHTLQSPSHNDDKISRINCPWFEMLTKRAKNVYMGLVGSKLCQNMPKPIIKIITEMGGGNMEDCIFCDWGVFEEPQYRNHICHHISTPNYSPTCPTYFPIGSPYISASSNYSPGSPTFTPRSPSNSNPPGSPTFSLSSPGYSPKSPWYNPRSPEFTLQSPSHIDSNGIRARSRTPENEVEEERNNFSVSKKELKRQ